MNAELLSWAWLWRKLDVELPEGVFQVVYSGPSVGGGPSTSGGKGRRPER